MEIGKEYKITIEKNKGITQALKKLIEKMPNSIISEGKITLSEWNATMDKLVELNEKRKTEGKETIFTSGTDKTRNGWHNSFVVHSKQEITFTEDEINELFAAMGVTINKPPVQQEPPNDKTDSTKVAPPKVEPPKEKVDTTKVAPPKVEPPKEKVDTTKVVETKDEPKTENAKKSNRLSWSEIAKIAWKSTKKFVKGMFCDEEGKFSIGRTAATVGVIAGLALAAPVTAALGASAAVVGTVATTVKVAGVALTGYMLYNGGKNAIKGTNDYYNAKSKEDAVEAMEQAWDGGVELASIPVLGGLMKTGSKLLKFVKPKASTPKGSTGGNEGGCQISNTQPKPVETASTEARPVEGVNEGGNQVANTQSTPAEVKPVENSTTNQSSSTQSSSSSQSSVVESQQTTPKVETRLETTSVQSSTKTEPKVETKPKTETTTTRVRIKADDVTISHCIDGVIPPKAYQSQCYLPSEPNACPDVRYWLTEGLPYGSSRPYAVKYNVERTESIIVIGLPGRPGSNVTLKIKGFVPKANVEQLAQYVQNNIAKVDDYRGMASRIESLGHKGFADILNGSTVDSGVRSVSGERK